VKWLSLTTFEGINSLGNVWRLPAGSSTWARIPGTLREISYGKKLWGLNA
jgi:hypothetical protein